MAIGKERIGDGGFRAWTDEDEDGGGGAIELGGVEPWIFTSDVGGGEGVV